MTVPVKSRAQQVRARLLPVTLAHAVENSAYYRERIGRLVDDVEEVTDVSQLPLLLKEDLQERVDDLRTIPRFPDYLMYSSGTTGEPLEVPVYREEIEANDTLLIDVWKERLGAPLPLTIAIQRVGHGSHIVTSRVPTIPVHINYGLDELVHKLRARHWLDGRRVRAEVLEANVLNIRQVTSDMLASGIDPSEFGLQALSVSGWHVPRWERRFLAETWGAVVLDRYGVTEVNGDAKWCLTCERYHFDFTVIPEVLDPATGAPLDEGIGHMVLTGLYPFNQGIPKIRYFIGDIVEAGPAECGSDEMAIAFLARTGDAVVAADGSYTLFSTDVAEVLAPLPDVARKPKTGFMKFRLGQRDGVAHVEVELTYPPAAFPDHAEGLRYDIAQSLMKRSRTGDACDVTLVPPGHLVRITKV